MAESKVQRCCSIIWTGTQGGKEAFSQPPHLTAFRIKLSLFGLMEFLSPPAPHHAALQGHAKGPLYKLTLIQPQPSKSSLE
jgi:hypothetical protein